MFFNVIHFLEKYIRKSNTHTYVKVFERIVYFFEPVIYFYIPGTTKLGIWIFECVDNLFVLLISNSIPVQNRIKCFALLCDEFVFQHYFVFFVLIN